MTEKLYYADSYLFDFDGKIVNVVTLENCVAIILDKTAFFPEGGGQQADTGHIGSCYIHDVIEKDGIIYHYTKDEISFSVGDVVACSINKEKRFSRMQAHSGEHIVSGIAHSMFGVENVGFHMDDTLMTVDFDMPLTKEQLYKIEIKANECVYADVCINANIYSCEEAGKLSYRSKLDFDESVRLIEIEGVDLCACCAPHVKRTGEIGLIKILSSISHRGGVRITLICGKDAYSDYVKKHQQTLNIAASLCAKHYETDIAVNKLIEANSTLKFSLSCQQTKYLKLIAAYVESAPLIIEFLEDMSSEELRELCNLVNKKCDYAVILLSGNDTDGYSYCIYSDNIDLKMFVKAFNSALNGKGGGKGELVQGRINATKSEINAFIIEMRIQEYENEKKKES